MLATFRSNQIQMVWPKVEPVLQKVLNKIDLYYTMDNIKEALLNKQMQLWTSYCETQLSSVCITQIQIHPKYKYLEIVAMAGNRDCLNELEEIERWAKQMGCKKISISGRKGWVKLLDGYKVTSYNFEKELDNGQQKRTTASSTNTNN